MDILDDLQKKVPDSGTVSLDTEGLHQELGFALVCARRFEEAIAVLGQVPGARGVPWVPWVQRKTQRK